MNRLVIKKRIKTVCGLNAFMFDRGFALTVTTMVNGFPLVSAQEKKLRRNKVHHINHNYF